MIRAIKIRILPTQEQLEQLWKSVGTARYIYNWTLDRQNKNYKNGNKFLKDGILRKELTQLKKSEEFKWLFEVSNNVAKQAVKDACDAYVKFFKQKSSFPKFKTRKKSKPSFYNDNVKLQVKKNAILIEKIGWVKTVEQIPITKYYNPRISFDGKFWYISIGIEKEQQKQELTKESIGIDVGIKDLAICSNKMKFKNINKSKKVKKIKKKLKRLQKRVSRKYYKNKKGEYQYLKTNNIIKLEKKIKLVYRKLNNIRNNHQHQTTSEIVKTKPFRVVMETLNIKGMMKNRHLSKAIQEQSLYEFKTKMKYKCEFYGIKFVETDKWFPSSKLCSECGNKKKTLKLSERIYICEECGCIIDRDYNASINLSRYSV